METISPPIANQPTEEPGQYLFVLPDRFSYYVAKDATHVLVERASLGAWGSDETEYYKITACIPENVTLKQYDSRQVVEITHDAAAANKTLQFRVYTRDLDFYSFYRVFCKQNTQDIDNSAVYLYFVSAHDVFKYKYDKFIQSVGGTAPKPVEHRPIYIDSRYPVGYACQQLMEITAHTNTNLTPAEAQCLIETFTQENAIEDDALMFDLAQQYMSKNNIVFNAEGQRRNSEREKMLRAKAELSKPKGN